MFKKLWESLDGKKLWSAIVGAVTLYGVPYCRAKWPLLPWDIVLIPLLTGLGFIGVAHKVVKAKSKSAASDTEGTSEPYPYEGER